MQSEPSREDPITAPQPGTAGAARRLGKQAHSGEQLSLLDVRLSTANQRLDNLARGNLPTKDVEEEILALKRSKRDGVPLESGDILPAKYGFPMKLRVPTKLGFKNPKHIMAIEVTNTYPGGYWEDQGYNWFSGS